MNPKDKQFEDPFSGEHDEAAKILEHEYNEAMSQNPNYETAEDLEEKANTMWKAHQEREKNAS
jgi:hypothetical protein